MTHGRIEALLCSPEGSLYTQGVIWNTLDSPARVRVSKKEAHLPESVMGYVQGSPTINSKSAGRIGDDHFFLSIFVVFA